MNQDAQWDVDKVEEPDFKQLNAEEVAGLLLNQSSLSPWLVIGLQVFVGWVVALVTLAFTGSALGAWSSAYGALCVVVPALVFARGLARQKRVFSAGAALGGFFAWELVKVVLTVAMLFVAPQVVEGVSWLALLAGFVVTMKVYWVAVWLHSVRRKSIANV